MENKELIDKLYEINELVMDRRILQARNIITDILNKLEEELKEKKDVKQNI